MREYLEGREAAGRWRGKMETARIRKITNKECIHLICSY